MTRYIPIKIRKVVAQRASFRCEYCRLPEMAVMIKFQYEHIISIQHGGKTILSNLAYTCPICNSNKGPNIGTILDIDQEGEDFIRFYNPRKHNWFDHFDVENGVITPKSRIGEGTVKILKFNDIERVIERLPLIDAGIFP